MKRAAMALWLFVGVVILGLGLAVRCAPYRSVFRPGHVNLVPADSHYYIRLAERQMASFPSPITEDPLLGDGARVLWPIGHTLSLGTLTQLFSRHDREAVAAWLGPLLSALLLVSSLILARRRLGPTGALVATGILALTPAAVATGIVGEADHHVHEPFLAFIAALLALDLFARPSTRSALLLGGLLGVGRLFTTSAFAVVIPILAALAVVPFFRRGDARAFARASLTTAFTCAAIGLLHAAYLGRLATLEYELASVFHPLLALSAGFVSAAAALIAERRHRAAALAFGVGALFALPLMVQAVRAVVHLGRGDPLLAIVIESLPLATDPPRALNQLGALLILVPAATLFAVKRLPRARVVELAGVFALLLAFALAAALQVRFAPYLVGASAALIGLASERWREGARPIIQRLAAAVALFWAMAWPHVGPPPEIRPQYGALRPTVEWLASVPDTSHAKADRVLASPFLGHFILLWAERPVVASSFSQLPEHTDAFLRAARFFAAPTEALAMKHLEESRAGLVLATIGAFPSSDEPGVVDASTWLLPRPCGSEERCLGAAHLRLIRVDEPSPERPAFVFQPVRGAVLVGRAVPGTEVIARTRIAPRDGRPPSLSYERRSTADAEGNFRIRVAQPTEPESWLDVVTRPYAIQIEGQPETEMHVPSHAVLEAHELRVPRGDEDTVAAP